MNCAPGLLFSFVTHRCEWPSMCNIAPKNTEPVLPPASQKVVISTSRELKAEHCTDYDCTSLPDGNYQIGECVGRFVMCSNGRAYVQFCPSGLVYNPGKGLCDCECGSQVAASPTEEKYVSNQALRPCSPTPTSFEA
ncbi:unnamed protein product [Cylicocyclus nassatus]|uniref:Chitin-binding type-2 domain-containing protein n=1 Tax=Cylicocyclus nassatus TaxID=53992 RepID=A0AA36HGS5_CYLNA|nr:unnamed protein product [Cylicocyclus nassatus]